MGGIRRFEGVGERVSVCVWFDGLAESGLRGRGAGGVARSDLSMKFGLLGDVAVGVWVFGSGESMRL